MLKPVEWKFRPTTSLSDIKDSKKYKPMMVVSAVKEGITPDGKVAVYARVRYFDEQTGTVKVGYAMEVEE